MVEYSDSGARRGDLPVRHLCARQHALPYRERSNRARNRDDLVPDRHPDHQFILMKGFDGRPQHHYLHQTPLIAKGSNSTYYIVVDASKKESQKRRSLAV